MTQHWSLLTFIFGEGHGRPLQYSGLENPHGQRSLVGYSPRGRKESDMTEWLSMTFILNTILKVRLNLLSCALCLVVFNWLQTLGLWPTGVSAVELLRQECWSGLPCPTSGTQGSNPGLPHCWRILYRLNHQGSSRILEWVAYPFSRGSSQPRNRTRVSCIAGRFFTSWASLYQGNLNLLSYIITYQKR